MDANNQLPPNEWTTPLLEDRNNTKRRRQCGFCGIIGHNKHTCPEFINEGTLNNNQTTTINNNIPLERVIFEQNNDDNNNDSPGTDITSLVTKPDEILTPEATQNIQSESSSLSANSIIPDRTLLPKTMYVVYDLETTGLSLERHQIIKIAGQVLDPLGNPYGESFESLVNPLCSLTYYITNVTGLKDTDLIGAPLFREEAVTDFFKYIITQSIRQYEEQNNTTMQRIRFGYIAFICRI